MFYLTRMWNKVYFILISRQVLLLVSLYVKSNCLWPHGLQHARLLFYPPLLVGFAQTHVHWVSDAIQPSHSLPPSSSPTFCLSQHQGLFQWVTPSHQVAKVLELQLQHRLQFYSMFGCTCLGYTVWSVCIHLQTSIKKITQSVLSQYVNHGDFTRKFP